jgi:hypothetical protein
MPCYQSNNLPSGVTTTGRTSYATEAECNQACKEGACCEGTTCSDKPACQCQGAGKVFKGVGTVCVAGICCCSSRSSVTVTVSNFQSDLFPRDFPRSPSSLNGSYTLNFVAGSCSEWGYLQNLNPLPYPPGFGQTQCVSNPRLDIVISTAQTSIDGVTGVFGFKLDDCNQIWALIWDGTIPQKVCDGTSIYGVAEYIAGSVLMYRFNYVIGNPLP